MDTVSQSSPGSDSGLEERTTHVCPWWVGYLLASPVRRLFENPERLLRDLVKPGMTVLDVGCAMGFFSLPAARIVGEKGRVVAIDLQPKMLASLERRARRRNLQSVIEKRLCGEDHLPIEDLNGHVDVVLLIHVVHEVPDARRLMEQVAGALRSGGKVLLVEPRGHVTGSAFDNEITMAHDAGLQTVKKNQTKRGYEAVLQKL